jgi:hypothetical protein
MSLTRDFVERMQVLAQSRDFNTLIDLLIEKYQEEWRTSPPGAPAEHREDLHRMVRACEALRKEVQSIALDERIEAHNARLRSRTYRPDSW